MIIQAVIKFDLKEKTSVTKFRKMLEPEIRKVRKELIEEFKEKGGIKDGQGQKT